MEEDEEDDEDFEPNESDLVEDDDDSDESLQMEDENSSEASTSASTSSKASASALYEESDAEEEYEKEKVLNAEVNKRLLEMGLSPNSLKKHKRQLKEKLIQKQIAFLSQKKSSSHRTASANPRNVTVNVTVNETVKSNDSNKVNKEEKLNSSNKTKCEICHEIFTKQGITRHTNSCRKKQSLKK
jgi:hypothetical protein